jgi:glyoxylase-like metal-dependent hydrolase (beta-lactamase superfamily II)
MTAPVDPRTDVPAFGTLPRVAVLDEQVTRVLAPNAGLLPLDGTNTYLVGAPGSSEVAIIDPGPPDDEHVQRVEELLRAADATCRWILVTHHHLDHAEAAQPWGQRFGAQVAASTAKVAGPGGRLIGDGDRLSLGSSYIDVVPTPGHCADHLAFRLESGAVLVGDHILGRGTSVISYPEGDLVAYLDSLRRVYDLGPSALYPGHGPEMTTEPTAVIEYYLAHRLFREQQILAALAEGPTDPGALVRQIYAAVDEKLWPTAERSTRAALAKLEAEKAIDIQWTVSLRPPEPEAPADTTN